MTCDLYEQLSAVLKVASRQAVVSIPLIFVTVVSPFTEDCFISLNLFVLSPLRTNDRTRHFPHYLRGSRLVVATLLYLYTRHLGLLRICCANGDLLSSGCTPDEISSICTYLQTVNVVGSAIPIRIALSLHQYFVSNRGLVSVQATPPHVNRN